MIATRRGGGLGRLGLSGGINRATTGRKLVGGDMLLSSANRIGKRACRVGKGKRREANCWPAVREAAAHCQRRPKRGKRSFSEQGLGEEEDGGGIGEGERKEGRPDGGAGQRRGCWQ